MLSNANVKLRIWYTDGRMDHLARNGDGDELMFVHAGAGDLFCDYGHLAFTKGDYMVLPRSTMWRIECAEPVTMLLIEATGGTHQGCRTAAWSAAMRSMTRRSSTRRGSTMRSAPSRTRTSGAW